MHARLINLSEGIGKQQQIQLGIPALGMPERDQALLSISPFYLVQQVNSWRNRLKKSERTL